MIDIVKKKDCVLCKACSQICPVNCIEFSDSYLSFNYPKVNKKTCIECNLCETVCPALNEFSYSSLQECYAVKNKDDYVLKNSSSGGLFYSIALYVLKKGGVVVGALFDENFKVKHEMITDASELDKLSGSKYVQSDMNDIFKKIKIKLKENKMVLFVGTSCQTAALTSFLGYKPNNLFLIDFVCHSVVSDNVFEEYKIYLEKKYKGKIVDFKFRDKTNGWLHSGLKVTFSNEAIYSSPLYKDVYMQGYFKNINTKEACETCRYKNFRSNSDITLGDFWGVDNLYPDFYDYYGNSILIVNSHIGKMIFENIIDDVDYIKITLDDILKYNKSLVEPFKFGEERDIYFKQAKKVGYIKPLEKYVKSNIFRKIFRKIKRFLKDN